MSPIERWKTLDRKLVAILRGIEPHEAAEIVTGLIETGFRAIEIPLNSPDPFRSIEAAVRAGEASAADDCLIGAGTVCREADVDRVAACGGTLIVSPNSDPAVISRTRSAGLVSLPGAFTATEALASLSAGATALKIFPASALGASGIAAIRAILPSGTEICAVGGVGPEDFPAYVAAGVRAFGLGSNLYAPGASRDQVVAKAGSVISAYDGCL